MATGKPGNIPSKSRSGHTDLLGNRVQASRINSYGTPPAMINMIFDKMEYHYGDAWLRMTQGRVLDLCTGDGRWIYEFLKRYRPSYIMGIDKVHYPNYPHEFRPFDLDECFYTDHQATLKRASTPQKGMENLHYAIGTFDVVMGCPPFTYGYPEAAYRTARRLVRKPTNPHPENNGFVVLLTTSAFLETAKRHTRLWQFEENRPEWVWVVSDSHWQWDGSNVANSKGFKQLRVAMTWRGLADVKYTTLDYMVRK